jgi:hypothetical protein
MSFATLPPHLWKHQHAAGWTRSDRTYVNFTPQRFDVRRIIVSITLDDMSRPAALAGKLYSNKGIWTACQHANAQFKSMVKFTGEASQMLT